VRYPVLIPTRAPACPPTRALLNEGLEITEAVMSQDDPNHYGRTMFEQWSTGKGFVVIEDDVVPWPGAIKQLQECPEDWCAFPLYRVDPTSLGIGLGCVRFSDDLVARHQPDGSAWSNTAWNLVEGQVNGMLEQAGETCHLHSPPVAHLKASVTIVRRGEIQWRN
jgi:hypothetical protein